MKEIEDLINAGPTNPSELKTPNHTIEFKDPDDEPIPLDIFQKKIEGSLSPEVEKTLKEEEEKAKKDEAKEKSNESKGSSDKEKITEETKTESKSAETTQKTEEKPTTSAGENNELLHLELGIPPNAANFFKKMDKSAREFVVAELKKRGTKVTELSNRVKELEAKATTVTTGDGNNLPPTWYEHPQAVQLLPEYQQVVGGYQKVAGIIQHYRQQFLANRNGDSWTDVVVGNDGSISYKTYKANDASEEHINAKILEFTQLQGKLEAKAQLIQANFNTNHLKSAQQMKAIEQQYFPQYADEKALSENEYYKSISEAMKKFGLDNHITAGLIKRLYLWAMDGANENETLRTKIAELEKTVGKGTKPNNGPTGDEINRGEASNKKVDPDDEEIEMSMFDKLTQRG